MVEGGVRLKMLGFFTSSSTPFFDRVHEVYL